MKPKSTEAKAPPVDAAPVGDPLVLDEEALPTGVVILNAKCEQT